MKKKSKQKGGRNGYYPNFKDSPCGGTLMYDGYTNHITTKEWEGLQAMQKLDGVANLNGGMLRNPDNNKWVKKNSKIGKELSQKYIDLFLAQWYLMQCCIQYPIHLFLRPL